MSSTLAGNYTCSFLWDKRFVRFLNLNTGDFQDLALQKVSNDRACVQVLPIRTLSGTE